MAFSIDTFTAKLKAGGALASLFEAELTTTKGPQQASAVQDFKFLCKSTTLPGDTIETATVTYMGRGINIPANRAAATWETTIYNDEGMEIRNYVESWMERLNSQRTNKRDKSFIKILDYTGEMKIRQLKKDGTGSSKSYKFHNIWPSTCPEIAMSWDTNEIQAFDVVWEYSYWSSIESGAGA